MADCRVGASEFDSIGVTDMAEVSASTSGAVKVTKEEVTCGLCSKFYSSPKLVECLHTFCQGCIQQHLVKEEARYIFVCPKCLHVTKTGASSAASLTSDLHVPRLLEVYRCHVTSVTPCTICTLEGNVGEATHRCLSCNDHLCTACSKKHTFSSLTATHRVVSLADLRSGKYDQEMMRKQTLLCKEHDQQECDFFCRSCSRPQCAKCIITKHKDHSFVDIKDEAEMKKSELLSLLKDYEESTLPQRIEVALEDADLELLQEEENLFVKTIKDQTKLIIEKITHQSRECLKKANEMFKEERTKRNVKKDMTLKRSERRQNILRLSRTLINEGGSEIVEMTDAFKNGIALLTSGVPIQTTEEHMTTFKAAITFKYDEKYFEVLQVDINQSEILTQRDKSRKNDTQGSVEVKEIKDKTATNPLITKETPPLKMKLKNTYTTKVGTDNVASNICSLSFRRKTDFLVLDRANAKLKIFTMNGELVYLVNLDGKCKLFNSFIHLSAEDYIVFVYENILHIRTKHLQPCKKIEISKNALEFQPIVANFAQDILVGNLPNFNMKVYNTFGQLLRTWKSQMKTPFEFLKYAQGDRLLSSNWQGTGSVSMESEKKGLLVKITGQTRLGLPWRPADGAVDKQGHIIVSDPKRNEISVFSSEGSQLYFYDTSTDAVSQPNCLFVDKTGLIYVSYKDGKVAVYMNKRV